MKNISDLRTSSPTLHVRGNAEVAQPDLHFLESRCRDCSVPLRSPAKRVVKTFFHRIRSLLSFGVVPLNLLLAVTVYAQPPLSGPAPEIRYLSPEEIGRNSPGIVHAKIIKIEPIRIGSRIYTDAHCTLIDPLRWDTAETSFVVRQAGGRIGDYHTWSGPLPDWHVGDEWVFGLARPGQGWWTVYGIKQGGFKVQGDQAVRDFSGFAFIQPPPDSVVGMIETIPIDVLKQRLVAQQPVPPAQTAAAAPIPPRISTQSTTQTVQTLTTPDTLRPTPGRESRVAGQRPAHADTQRDEIVQKTNLLPMLILVSLALLLAILGILVRVIRKNRR